MCGIVGIASFSEVNNDKLRVKKMISKLSHRGPDTSGFWSSDCNKIHFAHSRLAILDLTASGNQPMVSTDKNLVLVFNGEIYNFKTILKKFPVSKQIELKDQGDTRVLLEALQDFGLKKTLSMMNGMFAFALYNKAENKIYLVRDRFGEKPLYYGVFSEGLVFSSETKAIKSVNKSLSINYEAAIAFLGLSYVPSPLSIYEQVRKVEPGSYISIDTSKIKTDYASQWESFKFFKVNNWWSPHKEIEKIRSSNAIISSLAEVDRAVTKSVDEKMISDRPLGAFLSGGIDSSLIVSKMQELLKSRGKDPVRTYTIGFEENEYDESKDAELVAKKLGTKHKTFMVSYRDLIETSKTIATVYDEPFADSSQIPTLILCSKVAKEVTVALSGDGGDEVFGGYRRYFLLGWKYKVFRWCPKWLRATISKLISLYLKLFLVLNDKLGISVIDMKLIEKFVNFSHRLRDIKTTQDLYYSLLSDTKFTQRVLSSQIKRNEMKKYMRGKIPSKICDEKEQMMYWDTCNYLEGDILVKVDRAAMHFSLETRAPFLDPNVFESAWSMPVGEKIKRGKGKIPLKKILSAYLPKKLIDKPKAGFALPLAEWLRGPLEIWGRQVIFSKPLELNLFNYDELEKMWIEHKKGLSDHSRGLWAVIIFHLWYRDNNV